MQKSIWTSVLALTLGASLSACEDGGATSGTEVSAAALRERAYVVSQDSDELTVFDLRQMTIAGRVATGGLHNHMAELSADFGKVYVTSSETNEVVVVDARALRVLKRIPVMGHPTHLALSRNGAYVAIMAEDDNAVVFIDTQRDEVVKRLPGFYTPHFIRFAADDKFAYVANIGANHISRVDMQRLEIDGHIPLTGFEGPPNATLAPGEGGFADVQIDRRGLLYGAHAASGRVIVYDTKTQAKLPEVEVGRHPWVVFAEHPFADVPLRHLVPNHGDRTVMMIDGSAQQVMATLPGDEEAYGVNFSPKAPNKAFVMNRARQDIAVVDTSKGEIITRIPVGGNTETASTTADGAAIVATVSGADSVVVLDPETNAVKHTFTGIGKYPWSVTIPNGQNYCH